MFGRICLPGCWWIFRGKGNWYFISDQKFPRRATSRYYSLFCRSCMIGERSVNIFSLMGKTPTGNWWGGVRGLCLPYTLVLVYVFHDNLWQTFHITQLNSSWIMFLLFLTNRCPWWLTYYLRWKCLALQICRLWVNLMTSPPFFCQRSRPWLALLFCVNVWVNYDSICF